MMKKIKFIVRVAAKLLLLCSVPVLFISGAMVEAGSSGAFSVAIAGCIMAVPDLIFMKLEEVRDE